MTLMMNLFNIYVEKETVIRTGGFASYRSAVVDFSSVHQIVNHSIGFTNENDEHTNKIENLWNYLKPSCVQGVEL